MGISAFVYVIFPPMLCYTVQLAAVISLVLRLVFSKSVVELVIRREAGSCTTIARRLVHQHREVPSQRVILQRTTGYESYLGKSNKVEILRVFFAPQDEDIVEPVLVPHCPDGRPELSLSATSRKIAAHLSTAQNVVPAFSSDELPTMTVQLLFISGPSSNRVDLAFFADGCASIHFNLIF